MTNIIPDYFGAFFSTPEFYTSSDAENSYRNGWPILWGAARQHYELFTSDISYVRFALSLPEELHTDDPRGEFIADMTVWSADAQANMLAFVETGDVEPFHPVTQAMIAEDLASGLSREDIVDARALIMTPEFLGFCPAHVLMKRPELAVPTLVALEDGSTVERLTYREGRLWKLDNPEFA